MGNKENPEKAESEKSPASSGGGVTGIFAEFQESPLPRRPIAQTHAIWKERTPSNATDPQNAPLPTAIEPAYTQTAVTPGSTPFPAASAVTSSPTSSREFTKLLRALSDEATQTVTPLSPARPLDPATAFRNSPPPPASLPASDTPLRQPAGIETAPLEPSQPTKSDGFTALLRSFDQDAPGSDNIAPPPHAVTPRPIPPVRLTREPFVHKISPASDRAHSETPGNRSSATQFFDSLSSNQLSSPEPDHLAARRSIPPSSGAGSSSVDPSFTKMMSSLSQPAQQESTDDLLPHWPDNRAPAPRPLARDPFASANPIHSDAALPARPREQAGLTEILRALANPAQPESRSFQTAHSDFDLPVFQEPASAASYNRPSSAGTGPGEVTRILDMSRAREIERQRQQAPPPATPPQQPPPQQYSDRHAQALPDNASPYGYVVAPQQVPQPSLAYQQPIQPPVAQPQLTTMQRYMPLLLILIAVLLVLILIVMIFLLKR